MPLVHNQGIRQYRANGGQNWPQMPNMPPLTQDQIAAAIPKSAVTPMAGKPLPQVPPNRIGQRPMPQKPPNNMPMYGGYHTGGRLHRATGGQNFSQYVADVPVGGSTGAMNSPYAISIGSNGVPTGSVPPSTGGLPSTSGTSFPTSGSTPSSVPNPNAPPPAAAATAPPPSSQNVSTTVGASPMSQSQAQALMQQYGLTIQSPQQLSYIESLTPDEATAAIKNPENQGTNPFPNANGGKIPNYAAGGMPTSSEMAPWFTRREASDQLHTGGLFHGSAPGRADTLPVSVVADSHIIPADVIGGLGEGNTAAGANVMNKILSSGPWGMSIPHGRGTSSLRLPAAPQAFRSNESQGGRRQDNGHKTVPIAASSGEYNCKPEEVYGIGMKAAMNMKLDPKKLTARKVMDLGHDILDSWIVHTRKKIIEKMKRLKPPAKD